MIYRHALRSALTPVVTQFGIDLGALIGGAVITETGLQPARARARPSLEAIRNQDLPIIIGIVLLAAAAWWWPTSSSTSSTRCSTRASG